jgi:hypothetical protein
MERSVGGPTKPPGEFFYTICVTLLNRRFYPALRDPWHKPAP